MTYEAVPLKRWVNKKTGAQSSIFGAVPWMTAAEKDDWEIEQRGWGIKNIETGKIKTKPYPPYCYTKERAEWVAAEWNKQNKAIDEMMAEGV